MGTHEIIQAFEAVFGEMIDLPACISICDNDGLLIYSVGECANQWALESLLSYLIMSFEASFEKLVQINEVLDSLVITTGDKVYYIDNVAGKEGLYMIIQTTPVLMSKVLPFLRNIVLNVEKSLSRE